MGFVGTSPGNPSYRSSRLRKRDPVAWEKRLAHFLAETKQNTLYGNWDDAGLPRTE